MVFTGHGGFDLGRGPTEKCGRVGREGTSGAAVTGQRPLKAPTESRTMGDVAEGAPKDLVSVWM